jgi:hypothetical protein
MNQHSTFQCSKDTVSEKRAIHTARNWSESGSRWTGGCGLSGGWSLSCLVCSDGGWLLLGSCLMSCGCSFLNRLCSLLHWRCSTLISACWKTLRIILVSRLWYAWTTGRTACRSSVSDSWRRLSSVTLSSTAGFTMMCAHTSTLTVHWCAGLSCCTAGKKSQSQSKEGSLHWWEFWRIDWRFASLPYIYIYHFTCVTLNISWVRAVNLPKCPLDL